MATSATTSAAAAFLCTAMIISVALSAPEGKRTTLKKTVAFQKLIRLNSEAAQPREPRLGGKSLRPLNRQCGRSKYPDAGNMELPAPRIVGGQDAREHELPWQVSLRYDGRHFCGGSVLAQSWILSAAHCFAWFTVEDVAIRMTVVVGEHRYNATNAVRQMLRISYVVIGDFDRATLSGDIALVKLRGTIRLSRNVAPICLPASDSSYVFKKCVVSGWGRTKYGGNVAETLQYTTLNITSNVICNATMYANFSYAIYESMLCATDNLGGFNRSACHGDSGGPLAVKGNDGRFTVAGITSWGIGCAFGYPGVYTRVSSYIDSICQITGIKCTTK